MKIVELGNERQFTKVNFEADSVKGLKRSFKEAVEDYMETCGQLNKLPDSVNNSAWLMSPDL